MNDQTIRITFTGDFCPINRTEKLARDKSYAHIFNDIIEVFKNNDLNVTDLECPLTTSVNARAKTGPHQKADPVSIGALKYAGIGLAVMANNHIMDYGSEGAEETLRLCKESGINIAGIGKSSEDAARPFILNTKGKKIAIFNFADNEFLRTPDKTYTCNPIDPVRAYYDITKAKTECDHVVIVAHAGNEFYPLPSPKTKTLYRYFIDTGADAVISHHTHAYSGYEIYKSKPIFYGLGNFIYDWPGKRNSNWNKGYIVRLLFDEQIDFEIIPLIQSEELPGVFHANAAQKQEFEQNINKLNSLIADDDLLSLEFEKYCESVYPMYDAFIEPYFGKYIAALRKRGFFPRILTPQKRLFLLNLTRCDSHREVLIRMLGKYEVR